LLAASLRAQQHAPSLAAARRARGCTVAVVPFLLKKHRSWNGNRFFEICIVAFNPVPTLDLFNLTDNDAGGTWNDDNATGALSGSIVDLTSLNKEFITLHMVTGIGSCLDDTETVRL
jgi:hypothetical protein